MPGPLLTSCERLVIFNRGELGLALLPRSPAASTTEGSARDWTADSHPPPGEQPECHGQGRQRLTHPSLAIQCHSTSLALA